MDYQLWKIYWAFRNGDSDGSTELLAIIRDADHQNDSVVKGLYGDTLLHLACQNGWLDYVKFLVEVMGCDPEVKDWGDQTPLHYCCRYGRLDVVQYLTKVHNCDLAAATRDHWTPLHYACRYGHSNIVEHILDIPSVTSRKQLTHVAYFRKLIYLIDKQSNPAIVLLQIACSFGQVQVVEYLCDKHGSHQHLNDDTWRRRLFIFCCKYGLLQIVTELGSSVTNHIDTQGRSGLHHACQNGHINLAKYFIDTGCDINKVDRDGYTPLQLACQYSNNIDIVQYMLDNLKCTQAWVEALNIMLSKQQWSDSQCIDLIKLLISTKEWLPNSSCNAKEDTLLHLSARYHRSKVAHFLLSEINCDPNELNKDGTTPLDLATDVEIISLLVSNKSVKSKPGNAIVGRMITHLTDENDSLCIDVLKTLIGLGQWNPNLSHNSEGDTALHLALRQHRANLAHFLLSKVKCDPNIKNLKNEAPIQLIIKSCSDSECVDLIKEIITTKTWDPDSICNSEGDIALHLSVWYHRQELTNFLVFEAGSFVNVKNEGGETPLSLLFSTSQWTDSDCVQLMRRLIKSECWDPNSACDSEDNTVLHLAALYHRPEVAKCMVLSGIICDPNIKNAVGETPIEVFMSMHIWSDSDCISIIKFLIVIKKWDPNSNCTLQNDTVLHLAARYHRPMVAHFLLSEDKCDPNIKNQDGLTPLDLATDLEVISLLISSERVQSKHGNAIVERVLTQDHLTDEQNLLCTVIVKTLIDLGQWNPNLSHFSNYDTALHLAVMHHKPRMVDFLLCEAKCDASIKNSKGETLMELLISGQAWKDSECVKIIRALMSTNEWDPNSSCNSNSDTALHLTVRYYRRELMQFLLFEAKCDPNIKNKMGETLFEMLMADTTCKNSKCIEIIKALLATKQWDPNSSCNSKGDTALHLSIRHGKPKIVHFLLSEAKCDPNSKNLSNETPLQLANETNVISDLIRHGSNPDNVYKLYGKSVSLVKPLRPSVKVFIIGNSGVGKSTLTEALKIEASFLTRPFAILLKSRVSDVDEKTAGIVPHDFKSKNYGCVTFYDFAGHREFYSSHAAFLHNVIQGSSPIFLLVVNLSIKNDDIQQHILYWLSFVENQCSVVNCTSHVIVIGSHADIVLSGGDDPQQKAMEISESIKKKFGSSIVEYIDIYPMDCQYSESPGMTKLRNGLIEICNCVRIPKTIPFNAHCFHVLLLDKFRTSIAITVQEIQDQIKKEQTMNVGITKFLPDTSAAICKVCDELNNRGHILFLKNASNAESSWVIIDKAILLSEVTGTTFAPKNFKQHCQLAESTGVVPLSKLTEQFPLIKTEVLIGFMTHLEFCREIIDSELLELIMKHHESLTITIESERYFLFPGLITQQVPDNLWEQNQDFKYHCGWVLQCTSPDQFFSSRFLQVLLLRLAFSFALVKVEVDETIPAFQRECSIWKNGIFWGEIFGMETIIEVHSNNKTVILQIRCREEHLLCCIAQRSHIIRRILQCVQDFCPQIRTVDSFIHPSGATKFPIKLTSEMPRFNVQKIAEAIVKFGDRCPLSVVSARQTILLDDLITFEPYAEVGLSMLKSLNSDENDFGNKLSNQALEMLSLKLSRKANFFIEIFKEPRLYSSVPLGEELLIVLKQWRDGCEGSYKCLKEKLDQYSIFTGRNILELSRIPLQIQDYDENDNTNDNDSEMPTCTEHATMPSATADISDSADKPFQDLPVYDNLDEDRISSLPTYESATILHTVPTGPSSTADDLQDDAMDNKSLEVPPGYDEIDEDKAAAVLSLPTYETASKSNITSLKMKDHCGIDEGDNDARRKTLLGNCLCASAAPKLHQLDCLEGNGKKVKLIDATAAVWDKVAIRLHFEGHDIARISRDHHLQSVQAVTTVVIEWLDGKGRQPASWAVLITALKETELFTDIVNDLECIVGISDDFIAHDEPQEAVVSSPCTSSVLSQPQRHGNNSFVSTATKPKLNGAKATAGDSEERAQMKLERRSDLPQPDHKPKLSELQVLKGHGVGRKVKVINGVGDRWKELAKSLDFDGLRIDSIDMKVPHEQPEEACQQMLTEWLDGDDDLRGPVTWATLIQGLIDAGLMDIVDRLKELINY